MNKLCYFWFRRDLRLEDNSGFFQALSENETVQPVFIFDRNILNSLETDDARVTFIYDVIKELKNQLIELGSDLLVYHDTPEAVWNQLLSDSSATIYCNHDYEPYAQKRDKDIEALAKTFGGSFHTFKDQVIFEKGEVVKSDGNPYKVFTPYSKIWKKKYAAIGYQPCDFELFTHKLKRASSHQNLINLNNLGFSRTEIPLPPKVIQTRKLKSYDLQRNFPALEGTSLLGTHLRFGTLSIRKLVDIANRTNEVFLNELIWREFYMMILWHYPHVVKKSFKPQYDHIPWSNNTEHFNKWCDGQTGYPLVDAGMRELNTTGYMHNRVRMVVASFLCKHLLIDWRWGEAYFAEKLLDFELASNNGGWQWASGTGCDAAPYFRVFNPETQAKKFDAENKYINKWVPEVNEMKYPQPIVEHKTARLKAIATYKKALESHQSETL